MSNETTWSDLSLATPAASYWLSAGAPRKGEYGGACFHPSCTVAGADWYNHLDTHYYCDRHARALNEQCKLDGMPKACALHF